MGGVEVARAVKPILDATVAALQTQGEGSDVSQAVRRLADATGESRHEIANILNEESMAVLGSAPQLWTLRRHGLELCPSDDRCVAAEFIVGESDTGGPSSMQITVATAEARRVALRP